MTDWTLFDGDPAPGDPPQIVQGVTLLRGASRAMDEVGDELARISSGSRDADLKGAAADALEELICGVRDDLRPISASFDRVASALGGYASILEQLQDEARRALVRAQVAEQRRQVEQSAQDAAAAVLDAQRRSLRDAKQHERSVDLQNVVDARSLLDPTVASRNAHESQEAARRTAKADKAKRDAEAALARIQARLRAAEAELEAARRTARSVHERWDEESRRAARSVDGALADALKNRSNWEKALDRVSDMVGALQELIEDPARFLAAAREVLLEFAKILGALSTVFGILAKIALFIGLPELAATFELISLTMAAMDILFTLAAVLIGAYLAATDARDAHGRPYVRWGDVAFDGIGLAVSVAFFAVSVGSGSGGLFKGASSAGSAAGKEAADVAGAGVRSTMKVGAEEGLKYPAGKMIDDVVLGDLAPFVADAEIDMVHDHVKAAVPSAFAYRPRPVSVCVPRRPRPVPSSRPRAFEPERAHPGRHHVGPRRRPADDAPTGGVR